MTLDQDKGLVWSWDWGSVCDQDHDAVDWVDKKATQWSCSIDEKS